MPVKVEVTYNKIDDETPPDRVDIYVRVDGKVVHTRRIKKCNQSLPIVAWEYFAAIKFTETEFAVDQVNTFVDAVLGNSTDGHEENDPTFKQEAPSALPSEDNRA